MIKDYIHRFTETLGSIEARHPDPLLRLREFSQLFVASAHDGLLPLCGALAAEMAALPISLQELTREFFESQLDWLTATLNDAVQLHHWLLDKPVEEYAFMLLSTLEGSSLIDWALGRSTYPLAGFNHLLETLAIRS
ncbi:MAG TPA: TetR/AcrR family transcriptional regulator [Pseudomonas sp.]|uniref:TetR/AcrR family transcriptional regulator n=1 Tax=Pseudomonas sp. TaxID=306 RepID=UPI002D00E83C|nr:TetR/AcrR family transcriptional regulator [Pseudomonas sp.]HWH86317.1 TetR/AcrR family transcriptional regulator [Pseudomonas sp.]